MCINGVAQTHITKSSENTVIMFALIIKLFLAISASSSRRRCRVSKVSETLKNLT